MQSLDLTISSSLEMAYNKECELYMVNDPGKRISQYEEYWEKDGLVDDVLQQLVIDLGGEESSDSEIESEEEDNLDHDIVPIIYSEDKF
ncbi:unnamed protein product [Parnassius apollo]|uniref:(apollo) hypothetical protein n=1 Tax=Parnassius apollo TaxID=110799 RepID=A0A8S3WJA3_PARAO|nr:unnamed protein product [Parnassius apollo]